MRINPCKSAVPENTHRWLLRNCVDQLSEVMADIFSPSLIQAAVPTCMKTTTIIPVLKSIAKTGLNDYQPVALMLIVTECFERLMMAYIKATINITADPHQYAYHSGRHLFYGSHYSQPPETEGFICPYALRGLHRCF